MAIGPTGELGALAQKHVVWATKNAADHAPNRLPRTEEADVMEPMSRSNVVWARIVRIVLSNKSINKQKKKNNKIK